jgi:two-component system OmpR family sensor kinase
VPDPGAPAQRGGDGDFGGRGPGGGAAPAIDLPPQTYGQRRTASGTVLGSVTLGYGQGALSPPDLPATVAPGRFYTVDAESGGLRYRVLAGRSHDGVINIVAVPMRSVDQTLHRLLLVSGIVIAAVLAALALGAFYLVRLGLRPLERMGRTAGAIAGGDLSHRVEDADERTEVGRLGAALNAMLDRLEDAFRERKASEDRLRRFIADASHELRTPLQSIRGYAEVFRLGAAADPEETATAMRRIEDEAARMGVLVEDLLTLARLDELPSGERVDVDLAQLAQNAAADARAVEPGRPIAVEAAGPVVVKGDPSRLHQVLANLLRNALVHTPPGSPVEVSVSRAGGRARLEVRDHGPGLPGGDPAQLFERFRRAGGAGRERGPAGAGLGLAIVAGIVGAHGGSVEAGNAAGGGASFVVELPATAAVPALT